MSTLTDSAGFTGGQLPVTRQRRGAVLVVTINRPEVRNAIDAATAEGLARAMDELDRSDDLRVGVLTGAGGYFSSGMDLGAFLAGESPFFEDRGFGGITMRGPAKPLIAAVEGFALAGGMELVIACDLVVAATGAQFGIPEVKRSLLAAGGALIELPRRMPWHLAMEMALTGAPVEATRLAEVGLINRLVEPGTALATAVGLAQEIAENAPLAVTASKRTIREQHSWGHPEKWVRQEDIYAPVRHSNDAREGAAAFKEKRPPRWSGT